jgi:uncharacterized RDD family membrane protein YckC
MDGEPLPEAGAAAIAAPAYGGFWIRFGAELIDELLLVILFIVVAVAVMVPTYVLADMAGREIDSDRYGNIIGPLIIIPLMWLYRAGFEASGRQATPGKLALGLKVTDEDGNRLTFGRASLRAFMHMLVSSFCALGFWMVAFTPRKQGLHDVIARSLVVRTR